MHVFPVAAVHDETFLARALEAYTSRVPSQVLAPSTQHPNYSDGVFSSPNIHDAPPPPVPSSDLPYVPVFDAVKERPCSSPPKNLFEGVGAASQVSDEFGLKQFQSRWGHDRAIRYADVEHLCTRVPFLIEDDPIGAAEKPVVRLEDSVITAFLDLVEKPALSSVTWDVVTGFIGCARFFIDKVSINKPWSCIGPLEARTVSYVYSSAGEDQFTVSVASLASKQGGVSTLRRALTVAVLCSLSPFWRMAVASSTLFRVGGRQVRRTRKAFKRASQQKTEGSPPAMTSRVGSKTGGTSGLAPGGSPGSSPAATLSDGQEMQLWLDAPGLDVEDRPASKDDLDGRCDWFWRHRPRPGDLCLSLLSYKTLGDLYHLRGGRILAGDSSTTFVRLVNVPGDKDCFYHDIDSGLMDRLGTISDLPKSNFWQDVGVDPG